MRKHRLALLVASIAGSVMVGCGGLMPQPEQKMSGTLHSLHAASGGPVSGYVLTMGGGFGGGSNMALDVSDVKPEDLQAADGKDVVATVSGKGSGSQEMVLKKLEVVAK